MRKTKIVCTIGPATSSPKMLHKLISAGADVIRLNFSHGSYAEHLKSLKAVRNISNQLNKPVGVIQDLCGPKIRIGKLKTDKINLSKNDIVYLTSKEILGDKNLLSVTYPRLTQDIKSGSRILINDGLIELEVLQVLKDKLKCRVITGGVISPHKGVNFPGTVLNISALTKKDKEDLKFAVKEKVDFVALSFVKTPEDILELKDLLTKFKAKIPVIAKIEKHEAVKNIKEIIQAADLIMVARGDLGVEVPIEEVPLLQKEIIKLSNLYYKPVITATQMLESMVLNPRPTRAEATDVANAIIDGTDAIMLSEETAVGDYPIEAVKTMDKIARIVEKQFSYEKISERKLYTSNVTEAVSLTTCQIAENLGAKDILTFTSSGRTARLISKYKPRAPILAVTDTISTQRKLTLCWGVYSIVIKKMSNTDKMIEDAMELAKKFKFLEDGDLVVITAGIPPGVSGSTNMIKVHMVGRVFLRGQSAGRRAKVTGRVCKVLDFNEARCKLEPHDILIVPRIDKRYLKILGKAKGLITTEGHLNLQETAQLKDLDLAAVLGVPSALDDFKEGEVITLDSERGLVYKAA